MRHTVNYMRTCAVLFAVSACTMSQLDPDAEVQIEGTVLAPDRTPLGGQEVVLVKEPDLGEVLSGIILVPATGFLACFGDDPPAICEQARSDTTDVDGRFVFSLKGRDTQGSIGNASYFTAATRIPPAETEIDGPSTSVRFRVQTEYLDLPAVQLWNPGLAIDGDAETVMVGFEAEELDNVAVYFETASGAIPVWSIDHHTGQPIDARLIEDASVGIVAVQTRHEDHGGFEIWSRTSKLAFRGSAGAPPSRGSECFVQNADNLPEQLAPCPLTDGELAGGSAPLRDPSCPADEQACQAAGTQWAYVDLGAVRPISLVVARGGFYGCYVEVSVDSVDWEAVSDAQTGSFAVTLPDQLVRYVRVSGDPEYGVLGLAEISVW